MLLQCCVPDETEDLPCIVLVSSGDGLMLELARALNPCPLEIRTATSCKEAGHEIERKSTADVIFTEAQLFDGDWKQVLQMARQSRTPSKVVVVSRFVDVSLYLDALEEGVFDFVVPPFRTVELGYIIVNAIYACLRGRSQSISKGLPNAGPVQAAFAENS